jgi:hypothetical protein
VSAARQRIAPNVWRTESGFEVACFGVAGRLERRSLTARSATAAVREGTACAEIARVLRHLTRLAERHGLERQLVEAIDAATERLNGGAR